MDASIMLISDNYYKILKLNAKFNENYIAILKNCKILVMFMMSDLKFQFCILMIKYCNEELFRITLIKMLIKN